ncbi:fungal-specific transcription factor domain-containing protein [Mycena vulgaris]|nr:fungal-specific transcription factor domain-containing protein [Mycena vulgaris]
MDVEVTETSSKETKPPSKAKRPPACDMCRRKKRRCDGGDVCNHCLKHNWTCTYVKPATIRAVLPTEVRGQVSYSGDTDYVERLKLRLVHAEALLKEPVGTPLIDRAIGSLTKPFHPPHPDDSEFLDVAASFRALSLETPPPDPGFQGKSSAAMLVKVAVAAKPGRPQSSYPNPSSPKKWTLKPWEGNSVAKNLLFPDDEVMESLVSLYFSHVNLLIPLLHRPTFEEDINQRLHMHHTGFASTVLLVCAVGSLYLKSPRVSKREREALGWRYYDQVELRGHRLHQRPTVYDLQAYCLAVEFLDFTANPRRCWSIVGFGLRVAEDVGAHRRRVRTPTTSTEEELEKRAFWVLQLFDAYLCSALGRSMVHDPLEFDISLPSECDDEYWGPSGPGRQPPGRPSTVAFFNSLLNLYRILHLTLRLFYCTTRSHAALGITDLQSVSVQLGGALDRWFRTIPPHLVWDPARPEELFFDQSATLHCFYLYTRILVHRPFLPAVHLQTPARFSTVAICNEAAKACIQVADVQRRRRPDQPLLFSQPALFTSGMVLMLNMRHPGSQPEYKSRALAYVHTAVAVLKSHQERWPSCIFSLSLLEQVVSIEHPLADGSSEGLTPNTDEHMGSTLDDTSSSFALGTPRGSAPDTPHTDESQATYGAPGFSPISQATVDLPRRMEFPPAFVGDEEIRSVRFHRAHNIDF